MSDGGSYDNSPVNTDYRAQQQEKTIRSPGICVLASRWLKCSHFVRILHSGRSQILACLPRLPLPLGIPGWVRGGKLLRGAERLRPRNRTDPQYRVLLAAPPGHHHNRLIRHTVVSDHVCQHVEAVRVAESAVEQNGSQAGAQTLQTACTRRPSEAFRDPLRDADSA
jgi:hypothetical protein